jgi:DNA-3-methyladenine glycosylase I
MAYHDEEWGVPTTDERRLFEKLCLEGFQAGLSWITILKKRDAFREAFHGFEVERVARMGERDVERLVKNAGIIRHRGKIESAINNAKRTMELVAAEGSLAGFAWGFEPAPDERPDRCDKAAVCALASTSGSARLSKALKTRGFTFVGPVTAYAFMQSVGIVNDHLEGCHRRTVVEEMRAAFERPA